MFVKLMFPPGRALCIVVDTLCRLPVPRVLAGSYNRMLRMEAAAHRWVILLPVRIQTAAGRLCRLAHCAGHLWGCTKVLCTANLPLGLDQGLHFCTCNRTLVCPATKALWACSIHTMYFMGRPCAPSVKRCWLDLCAVPLWRYGKAMHERLQWWPCQLTRPRLDPGVFGQGTLLVIERCKLRSASWLAGCAVQDTLSS